MEEKGHTRFEVSQGIGTVEMCEKHEDYIDVNGAPSDNNVHYLASGVMHCCRSEIERPLSDSCEATLQCDLKHLAGMDN